MSQEADFYRFNRKAEQENREATILDELEEEFEQEDANEEEGDKEEEAEKEEEEGEKEEE